MDHSEISRRGGNAKLKKHGKEQFSDMGKKSQKAIKRRYGKDFYLKLSRAGVAARIKQKATRDKERNNAVTKLSSILMGE